MQNSIKSIQAKLRQVAEAGNRSHQRTITRYFQERFLFRLSRSTFKDHFYLKGDVLIYALEDQASRPALNLELFARDMDVDQEKIESISQEVCEVEYDKDGATFRSSPEVLVVQIKN